MMLHFDQPMFLLLALLTLPLLALGWRATVGMDWLRRATSLVLRALLVITMAFVLAGPQTIRTHDHLTVIGLLDISGSVKRFTQLPDNPDFEDGSTIEYLRQWFRQATDVRAEDDRFGLVVFDGRAAVISPPVRGAYLDDNLDVTMVEGTNIAEAIDLGLALFPSDTARRLVLVSDGNQTMGDAVRAAEKAASGSSFVMHTVEGQPLGIPIDVLPIAYNVTGDVQIAGVEAPPNARPDQKITVRIMLESTDDTTGRLSLRHEGRFVDLNGAEQGHSRRINVPRGTSVYLANVELGDTPVNRFEAIFEPDDPADDILLENNRAEAFTATPSRGTVLVLDDQVDRSSNRIAEIVDGAGIPVEVRAPLELPGDLLSLQRYDLIILDDVPAYSMSPDQQQRISRFVHDLGGGLIMLGGENSFGAGGWNGTPIEDILPLELDPQLEIRQPTSALVLVLDKSGSMQMAVGGARATQQEVANEGAALAIESLQKDTLVGVVTFDLFANEYVPLQRNTNPDEIATKVRGISSGGGTDLAPALRMAQRMLQNADVQRKHVVCLSDGQSRNLALEPIVQEMADAGIRVSTIAVGDDADTQTMRRLAEVGRGEFWPVRNPRVLPRVLIDSVQVLNKPLIKEGRFIPVVVPTGSPLTAGLDNTARPLGGLVITAPKEDDLVSIEMVHPDGEPLLARWQAGIGQVVAFTSDVGGDWSQQWNDWPVADTFFAQMVRSTARPAMSREAELMTVIEDGRLHIRVDVDQETAANLTGSEESEQDAEHDEQNAAPAEYLSVNGTVYTPDGSAESVRLRQTAPGRYETSVPASAAGNYIVALTPKRGSRPLSPMIGGISQPTSPEYRRYSSNIALLQEISEMTGGRYLDIEQPQAVNLYDRSGMPESRSLLPTWRPLLLLVIGLLLLDIASRRIAWSAAGVRHVVGRALQRVAPARDYGEQAAATVAGLSRVVRRPQRSDTTTAAHSSSSSSSDGAAPSKKTRSTPRDVPLRRASQAQSHSQSQAPAQSSQHDESADANESKGARDPERVRSALDQLLGRSGATDSAKATNADSDGEPSEVEKDSAGDDDQEDAGTTSSLLAAKRRARQRYGKPDDQE